MKRNKSQVELAGIYTDFVACEAAVSTVDNGRSGIQFLAFSKEYDSATVIHTIRLARMMVARLARKPRDSSHIEVWKVLREAEAMAQKLASEELASTGK